MAVCTGMNLSPRFELCDPEVFAERTVLAASPIGFLAMKECSAIFIDLAIFACLWQSQSRS
jgi:hypothetical protein